MNLGFWKKKRVFITGHTGFKGAWLSLWLQELGASVFGYALSPHTSPNLFELVNVKDGMVSLRGDIRDLNKLVSALKKYKPQIVIHMAAQSLVRQSYKEPIETYQTNVIGTVHLLEAIRQTKTVKVVVNVTSDKCYENKGHIAGYSESDPLGGYDPYSSSKACSELVTAAYRQSFLRDNQVAVASARAGNVIGGGDWSADRVVPDCIRAWLKGKTVDIRNPDAIRPWQHVLESLSGYMLLAEKLYKDRQFFAEAWNFGPDPADARSVKDLLGTLASFWGNKAKWRVKTAKKQPKEAEYLKLDSSKARVRLGWQPRWSFEKTAEKTVEWYRLYRDNPEGLRQLTLEQIHEYMGQ